MNISWKLVKLLLVGLVAIVAARAQAPTGTIAGVVADAASRPIARASVRLTNQGNGLPRNLTTSAEGDYSTAALPPGVYTIVAEATGFSLLQRAAIIETGATTTLNLTLEVGEVREQVTVSASAPALSY